MPPLVFPSKSELDSLRVLRNESGYRNVYAHGRDLAGNTRWVAKVKRAGRLTTLPRSSSPTPAEAARRVAEWYADQFGPRWVEHLRSRKRNPWRAWYSPRRGGWVACVWLFGERVEVRRVTRCGRPDMRASHTVFASRDEAVVGCKRFARSLYGMFAPLVMFR